MLRIISSKIKESQIFPDRPGERAEMQTGFASNEFQTPYHLVLTHSDGSKKQWRGDGFSSEQEAKMYVDQNIETFKEEGQMANNDIIEIDLYTNNEDWVASLWEFQDETQPYWEPPPAPQPMY